MKTEILDQLIKEQKKVREDLETAIKERNQAADIDEGDTRVADEISQQEINKDFVRRFNEQIEIANKDLATLMRYKALESHKFEPGALVETKEFYFIIGVSVHTSKYKGKKVVSISQDAPVFTENEGKTEKDKLKMGKKEVDILSIS